jgi:hypothetical protein
MVEKDGHLHGRPGPLQFVQESSTQLAYINTAPYVCTAWYLRKHMDASTLINNAKRVGPVLLLS